MARNYRYSLDRRDAKLVGVCSTLGEIVNVDPTILRIGFVASAFLISFEVTLVAYVAIGIYFAVKRKRAGERRERMSDFDRMGEPGRRFRPSIHAARTELDETDRRMMAIDHHLHSQNDELAREIEALREDK
jgi:phage shock protein PspC (stress-responsive transcriptional regulator)